ncbi:cellulose synthase [Burkholderia sp. PAMC 28687]|uniref:cellulose biosynthesis protein BcsC n=1 Tax=Burkholderia sp. PAMC 28687 TaxID=1795874 RepID=UPI0007850104|nr:cellulose biosynthesis protein BcsC [Burkholderia sp. PAMC 28687]AMM18330.1 cellulose synthase [Burkholderia sp. PAMC 28687]
MLKRSLFPLTTHARARAIALSVAAGCVANVPLTAFAQAASSAADAGTGAGTNASANASANAPLAVLIDQGRYWQSHRRGDLAEQAWQKVLRIDPKQPDALYGMGIILADRKDGSGAQQYLSRLRQAAPQYPNIDELGRRLGETSPRDQTVNDARRLAQSGQSASAVQEYQRALSGKPATPELTLEYYQALAATPQGWDQARQGLTQLAKQNPNDPRYTLALAQHLTYRDTTRREGIARLAQLSTDSTVGDEAKKSWRQALLWLGARASDAPLYQAYLQASPDDPAVKARFDSMVQQDKQVQERSQASAATDARGRTVAEGFAALDRGDIVTGRARFSAVLAQSPNDADALGGMGVAALKQEKFDEARTYLERASRAGNAARWKDALTSATYWNYTSAGIGARSNGETAKAKSMFERAIALNPSDTTAQTLLGETLLGSGDPRGAEQAYRMALRRQADNPDAIRGLVGALAAQGRGEEALVFANQLNAEQQAKAGGINKLRGEAQAAQARAAEARGDLGAARSLFEDALLNNPDDVWMRLDLARIYVRQGAVGNARSMMDGLLAAHPDMTDALYASALLSAETQDWATGLSQLDRIPAAQRTPAMTALQHRLWVHVQADTASRMARAGQTQQAIAILQAATPVAQNSPELIGVLATAYLQAGDTGRALSLVRGAMASAPSDTGLLLQYAGILTAVPVPQGQTNPQQDAELSSVMRRLAASPLTPAQRIDFNNLNIGIVVKQADTVRQRGDLAGAYDVIAPWLAATPDNADLQAALARLYTSAGDDKSALGSYRVALGRRPDDVNLQVATIAAASGAKDFSFAETTAKQALLANPDDPRVLAAAGRMYHAEGDLSLASRYLKQALIAANTPVSQTPRGRQNGQPAVPRGWESAMQRIGSAPLPGTNPFEGKTAVDTTTNAANPAGTPTGPLAGLFSRSSDPAPGLPGYPQQQPYSQPRTQQYSQPYSPTQNVPNYLPPPQPAPYSTPYVAPYRAPANSARPVTGNGGYGPDTYGSSQSGAPSAAPLQPYPGQGPAQDAGQYQAQYQQPYQQPYQQQQAYPAQQQYQPQQNQQQYQQPYQQQDPAMSAPWPMSPAAQEAQNNAQAAQPRIYSSTPAARPKRTTTTKATQPASRQATRRYAPAADETNYTQQQPYAYPPQQQQQPYYSNQPYIPQPPAGYAQAYVPSQTAQVTQPGQQSYQGNIANAQTLGVADELAQINRAQSSTVSGGVVFRSRTGEDGLSNLTDIEAPIQGRIRAGNGHVVVTATPVTLDAGTAQETADTLKRFGSGLGSGLSAGGSGRPVSNQYGNQTASGVGLSVGYETNSVQLDVGTTPLGFREENVVGGAQYKGAITDKVSYSVAVARRAVTDSLLSYAGAHDAQAGITWGGITSNGGRFDLGWDDGTNGVYLNGSFQYYDGKNVASNTAEKGGGGFYTRLYSDANQTLTAGVNTTLMHYDKNLSFFTYGQGGYFSPQQYVILNLPVEYMGRSGAFTYDVKGSIGVQHYRQDASDYFPTNGNVQPVGGTGITASQGGVYGSQTKTGISYSFSATGEFQLAPQLTVGATASLGNAYQYREYLAAVYIRYSFTKQNMVQPSFPPSPVSSPYVSMSN